jgi:EAL domain-containing protein (putative c-di-GMP-specific phosphodiesterase class I)
MGNGRVRLLARGGGSPVAEARALGRAATARAADLVASDTNAIVDACAAALPEVLVDPCQPRLVFQPIADLNKGTVAGYEALARFDGPLQATPDKWFAAAATVGLGPALESRVVRAALAARENLPANCFLTVNVSPHALTTGPVMDEFLRGGELAGLFVELTEEQAITDADGMRRDLATLRDRGAMIALDDAGSGYSGLQRLLALRPELMKLDRSLVDGIDTDEAKRACVEMLGVLASRLNSLLLAEGIERPGELRELIALGVPLAQGFLLAKPAPPWATLGARTTAQIRVSARDASGRGHVCAIVEPVLLVAADDADAFRLRGFPSPLLEGATPPLHQVAVLLDTDGRPVALAVRDEDSDTTREVEVSLRLNITTPIAEAAPLCMERPTAQRFDPLLCTHDDGTVAGVVRMERIFGWLGRQ